MRRVRAFLTNWLAVLGIAGKIVTIVGSLLGPPLILYQHGQDGWVPVWGAFWVTAAIAAAMTAAEGRKQ